MLGVVLATIALLYFGRDILVPFALALLLAFVLAPLVLRLRRLGLKRVPAVIGVVGIALLVLGGLGAVVVSQLSTLADRLPVYERNVRVKLRSIGDASSSGGLIDRATKMLRSVEEELAGEQAGSPGPGETGAAPEVTPLPVEIHERRRSPLDVLVAVAGPILRPAGTAALVLVFLVFILLSREDLRDRLIRLAGVGDLHRTTEALDEAALRVSRYLRMQLAVNALYGVPFGIGLYVIGVPNPVLWGLLAIVLRFIPYAGPAVTGILPIALSFAVDPGWTMTLATLGLFLTLELVSNNFVEPWLYGASTGISSVAILLAAIFWTTLWGPVGLLLSTPLTVCLVVLGHHVPQLQFLRVLLGNEPVLPVESRFYQRLLAEDPAEAAELAEDFVAKESLERLCDAVVLPALALAERDRQRGVLDAGEQRTLAEHAVSVFEDVAHHDAAGRDGSSPTETAVEPGSSGESSRLTVLCVAARTQLDHAAATLLARSLRRRGFEGRVIAAGELSSEQVREEARRADLVCLSLMHSSPLLRARHLCKRVRRLVGGETRVLAGCWNVLSSERDDDDALATTTADLVATTFAGALEQIEKLLADELVGPMVPAPPAEHEEERLAELRRLRILDADPEEVFDRVTRTLAQVFETPISLISLVDERRQFWLSETGLPGDLAAARQSPRETSMCGHLVASGDVMVVEDVRKDRRFSGNAWLRERGIRFYAGAPLRTSSGQTIGSVCVIDTKARKISAREAAMLRLVADGVMREVELRRAYEENGGSAEHAERSAVDRQRELQLAELAARLLLPAKPCEGPGFSIRRHRAPSPTRGPRTFAHALLDAEGRVVFVLADLGFGEPASTLLSLVFANGFATAVRAGSDPGNVLTALNADLGESPCPGTRVTAIVGAFDPRDHRLLLASAGHPPPILVGQADARPLDLPVEPALLVETGRTYGRTVRTLEVGDRLLVYTDGAADVTSGADLQLGVEGLAGLAHACARRRGAEFLPSLCEEIGRFGEQQADEDVFLFVLERSDPASELPTGAGADA